MTDVAGGAKERPKKSGPTQKSSDVDDLREGISDLGDSVGDMATRQYQRVQDMATDALDNTSDAVQRNPYTAIGIGLGVGFLIGLVLTGGRGH
jgi:ElaB/YqjD/DUF883 family membrane-anchored ribosome-binding protein